jgi:uncharacterized protein YneF (UPF0154 family)
MIITIIVSVTLGFAGGFYAGIKNANSSKVAKAKAIADEFKK